MIFSLEIKKNKNNIYIYKLKKYVPAICTSATTETRVCMSDITKIVTFKLIVFRLLSVAGEFSYAPDLTYASLS